MSHFIGSSTISSHLVLTLWPATIFTNKEGNFIWCEILQLKMLYKHRHFECCEHTKFYVLWTMNWLNLLRSLGDVTVCISIQKLKHHLSHKRVPLFMMLKKYIKYAVPKHTDYVITRHRPCCHISTVHGRVSDWVCHMLGKQKREMFCLMVISVAKII